jgi:hypothetical protein
VFQIRKEEGGLEKLVGDISFIVPWYFLSHICGQIFFEFFLLLGSHH